MRLGQLLGTSQFRATGPIDIEISRIVDDSRIPIKQGDLFVAISGLTHDAHEFIPGVVARGVVAVVGEKDPGEVEYGKATYVQVKNPREALGLLASTWFGNPSQKLKVIGVTGTEGKTTTSNLIYHILENSSHKTGLISTINAKVGNQIFDTGLHVTNPEPLQLQELLAKMVEEHCEFAVLETTSIGLDQDRVAGVKYDSAVLTNITSDHLDYHKTLESYRSSKLKLFRQVDKVILNSNDSSFEYIKQNLREGTKIVSYGMGNSDYLAQGISTLGTGSKFSLVHNGTLTEIHTSLLGEYNIYNTLAAIAVTREYGISVNDIKNSLLTFKTPEGRLESISNRLGLQIYIDFAHTPNSVKNVLQTIKEIEPKNGRLIAVYGSAGERDSLKRPEMGKIGTEISDITIFTADDPRSEKVEDIIRSMESGIGTATQVDPENLNKARSHVYTKILERGEAIAKAIKIAQKGDKVAILGKGHEKSLPYNGIEYPWSDREAVEATLRGEVKTIQRK